MGRHRGRARGYRFAVWAAAVLLALLSAPVAAAQTEPSGWGRLQEAIRQAEAGGVVTLEEDLRASAEDSAITLEAGKSLTLDLNGHRLDRGLTRFQDYGCAITVQQGAILTIRDSAGTGVITGGYGENGGGIVNRGTLILEGGRVTGNTARSSGGGIANYGTLVLLGGSVTGNTALHDGGGLYNQTKAHLTAPGDSITGNAAPKNPDISNDGTLNIVDPRPEKARREDMPALRSFLVQLAVFPAAALLAALLMTVFLDDYLDWGRKKLMLIIIALVVGLLVQNYLEFRFSLVKGSNALRVILAVFGYAVRPAILALFLSVVKPGRRYWAAWIMIVLNFAVYATAFFTDIAFSFSSDALGPGAFMKGPLYYTCTAVSLALFVWLLILTLRQFRPATQGETWIPFIVTVLVVGAVSLDFTVVFSEQPISFLTMAIVISCVFYYIWLHLQFVRAHELGIQSEQRIETMMAQIQPHFLFNSLTAIRAAYRTDAEKGEQALTSFSEYLRHNMDALTADRMISLDRELEHVSHYLSLQQLRFGDKLRVRWELEATELRIPTLTLQPLVENAVTYGVRQTATGSGTVTIRSRDCGDRYEIMVIDDGPGLNAGGETGEGERSHIGLQNVRERLKLICGGELRIQSEPGRGVTATIVIPKEQTE